MANLKQLIEKVESEDSVGGGSFVEYPEGRYVLNFVQATELTDFISKKGIKYDAIDIEYAVDGWDNKNVTSRYFTAYDKDNQDDPELQKSAVSGTRKLHSILLAMGVAQNDFPEDTESLNEVLLGKSATCELKKREYEVQGEKRSTLDLAETFTGDNWLTIGSMPHIDIKQLQNASFETKDLPKKEKEDVVPPVVEEDNNLDDEIPF